MAVTVFAAPILPGKTDAWKRAAAEINGPRRDAYVAARRAAGIRREVAALQNTPMGDFVCVFIDADDASSVVQRMLASTNEFDVWFAKAVLADTHGITADGAPPPPNQVYLDFKG